MPLIRVCQWIKLQIQLITKVPVEVIRAGFRKGDKPSSKIPGMFKGQLYQLSFKLIRSANHPPMLPSSTLRNLVEPTLGVTEDGMADSASPESPGLTPQALPRDSIGTLTRPAGIDGLRLPGIRVLRSARPLRLAAMPSHAPPVLLSGDSLRLPPDSGTAGSDIAASLR